MRQVLMMAGCVLAGCLAAHAETPKPALADYCRALRTYADGDLSTAAAITGGWSASDLRHFMDQAPVCRDRAVSLETAAMLETDIVLNLEQTTIETIGQRLALVEAFVQRLPKSRAEKFQEQWYVAATSLLLAWTDPDRAAFMAERGLRLIGESAHLRLLAGMADEMRVHVLDGNMHDPVTITHIARHPSRGRLYVAQSAFKRAMQLDPQLHEARLHFGRTLFLLGEKPGEARDALTEVAASENAPDRLRYLAQLFLGAMDERAHDIDGARRHYEAALRIGPAWQTAYVALSFVEAAAGRDARARELVAQWSAQPPRDDDDPWWSYQNGGVNAKAFEWLRAQVIK